MFAILQLLLALSLTAKPIAVAPADATAITGIRGAYLMRTEHAKSSILFAQDADVQVPLASITKLMTAIVLFEQNLDPQKTVIIESNDIKGGAIPYLIPGDTVSIADLWSLMLIVSSNDAAAALVRASGMSEVAFVERMNTRAKDFGLINTHFADPSGLDPTNVSTAREIAALSRVAFSIPSITNESELSEFVFTPKDQASRRAKATNLFGNSISLPGFTVLGAKTGHIAESGYNLVVAVRGKSGAMIGVITGAPSVWERFTLMRHMLNRIQS